jgi:hypothetical protein
MKKIIGVVFVFLCVKVQAQELFVVTEPASNMPANSLGIRVAQSFMQAKQTAKNNYHIMPEVMWGASKKLMLHAVSFISNRNGNLFGEGVGVYGKYRLYSADDIHTHFRVAGYGRISLNRADIHQEEINTMGHNTGFETGIIATKLQHKIAISSSVSFEKALNNGNKNKFPTGASSTAFNYTLSFGKLVYPTTYSSLKQTNINVMVELLGQSLLTKTNKSFVDIVPSIQFIFNSQARVDFAYIKQLFSNIQRTAANGFYIKLEYSIFNVDKRKV